MGRKSVKTIEDIIDTELEKESTLFRSRVLVPSGSTLLNLACANTPDGAFSLGRTVNIIGDSHSGKSVLLLSSMAEMCRKKEFNEFLMVYDDVEQAMDFNVSSMFGPALEDRMISPSADKEGIALNSDTVQDFHFYMDEYMEENYSFVYGLDSLDALDAKEDRKKFEEDKIKRKKGQEPDGSYGMAKAKALSGMFRGIVSKQKKTNSVLFVISQTRDNPTVMGKYRAGGKALGFYSHHVIVLTRKSAIKKKEIVVGYNVEASVTKNKITGKRRKVNFPVKDGYGIDDTVSMIDYLLEQGVWKKEKQSIVAKEFDQLCVLPKLVEFVEESPQRVEKLKRLVTTQWFSVEESLKENRKSKY
jgi:RecA/RadA recombinase